MTDNILSTLKEIVESMDLKLLRAAMNDADSNHDGKLAFSELKKALSGVNNWDARQRSFDFANSNPQAAYYWQKKSELAFFNEAVEDCAESSGITKTKVPDVIADLMISAYSLKGINSYLASKGLPKLDDKFVSEYVRDYRLKNRSNGHSASPARS